MRWKVLTGLLLLVALGLGAVLVISVKNEPPTGAVIFEGTQRPTWDPADPLVVATWNIHYGAGPTLERGPVATRDEVADNLERISAAVREWKVDILALQEVDRDGRRTHGIDQLEWLRKSTGLEHAAWTETWNVSYIPWPGLDPRGHLGRVRSGQAVLSRFPLDRPRRYPLIQPVANGILYNWFYLHRALLEVWVDLGEGRHARVIDAHLEAFDVANKERHAEAAQGVLAETGPYDILLGDMNAVPPEAKLRSAFPDEPESDFSEDKTLAVLRAITGLTEVVPLDRYARAEEPWFTFPAHAPNRRLDYIFHGGGFQVHTVSVPRLDPPASDHLPVLASFGLR